MPSSTNRTPGSPWAPGCAPARHRRRRVDERASAHARPPAPRSRPSSSGRTASRGSRRPGHTAGAARIERQRRDGPRTGHGPVGEPFVCREQALEEGAVGRGDRLRADRCRTRGERPGHGPTAGTLAMEEDEVGRGAKAIQRGRPGRLEPARDLARDPGPGVPIGEDDVATRQPGVTSSAIRSAASAAARSAATRTVRTCRPRGAAAARATRRDVGQVTAWVRRPFRSSQRARAPRPADFPDPSSPSAAMSNPRGSTADRSWSPTDAQRPALSSRLDALAPHRPRRIRGRRRALSVDGAIYRSDRAARSLGHARHQHHRLVRPRLAFRAH